MSGNASKATYVEPFADPIHVEDHYDSAGNLKVASAGAGGATAPIEAAADAMPNTTTAEEVLARLLVFNGTTWDRLRNQTGTAVGKQLMVSIQDAAGTNQAGVASSGNEAQGLVNSLSVLANMIGWTDTSTNVRVRIANIFKPQNAVNTNAEITIWTPTAGKKFRLMGYHLSASVAGNVLLRDNTAGTIISIVPSGAGGSGVMVLLGNGILSAVVNNVLTATGPAASTLSGVVFGTEE